MALQLITLDNTQRFMARATQYMTTHTIITLSVISTLIVGFVIHKWIHNLLTLKMDEGSIIQYFKEHEISESKDIKFISCALNLTEKRTLEVCQKSINLSAGEDGKWLPNVKI